MKARFLWAFPLVILSACDSHPTTDDLEAEFVRNRAAFDALADMAEEDAAYSRISYDFVHPKSDLPEDQHPGDPPGQRWAAYRKSFKELDLESGVTNYENGVVVLQRSSKGMVTAGSSISFMRAPDLPAEVDLLAPDDDLACTVSDEGWCSAARNLDDDWYLLIERH